MSVGFFMGIRASYTEDAQDSAESYVTAINQALLKKRLPSYVEPSPEPDVYDGSLFGRSMLDHDSGRLIDRVANLVIQQLRAPHFGLLAENCYRVAFVPIEFDEPLLTEYSEELFGDETAISVGSSPVLFREIVESASLFGVPIVNGSLSDSTAAKINEYEPLFEGDVVDPNLDVRTTWLLLHEGARLSVQHGIALSLAG